MKKVYLIKENEKYFLNSLLSVVGTDNKGNPKLTILRKSKQEHLKLEKGFLGGNKRTYRTGKWNFFEDIHNKHYKPSIDIVAIANLINNEYKTKFKIKEDELISESYSDLLLK